MKCEVERGPLLRALNDSARVAKRGAKGLPVLASVRVEAHCEGWVKVEATDLESWLSIKVEADAVAGPGAMTVPVKELAEVVKGCGNGAKGGELVTLESEGERLTVSRGAYSATLEGGKVEDWPERPLMPETWHPLPLDSMTTGLEVLAFTSKDETRWNLNGVQVEDTGPKSLRWVATDGHRLGWVDTFAESETREVFGKGGLILHRAAVADLPKLAKGAEAGALALVGKGPRSLWFTLPARKGEWVGPIYGVRPIDGDYPNYRQVLPKPSALGFDVIGAELAEVAARVAKGAPPKSHAIKVEAAGDRVLVSTVHEGQRAADTLGAIHHRPFEPFGLNARYLAEALKFLKGSEVAEVRCGDGEFGPLALTRKGYSGRGAVVMPMRLDDAFKGD